MYDTMQDLVQLQSRRPRPATATPGTRLVGSRAGRAILVAGAVVVLMLGLGFAHGVQGTAPAGYQTVTVQPGDTLWTLAERRYPNEDIRSRVLEIERINGLHDPVLHSGQSLRMPASSLRGPRPATPSTSAGRT